MVHESSISYRKIFSPFRGNIFQRILKLWIIPWWPRLEIFLLTLLGVGVFKYVLMNTIGRVGRYSQYQTNYHIGRMNMNNLLKFATNQTMFNEGWHIFAFVVTNLPYIWRAFATGDTSGWFFWFVMGFGLLNIYCVLLQRYNRARLVLAIERLASKGYYPDEQYSNWLALDIPIKETEYTW